MTYPSRVSAVSITIRDLLTQPPVDFMQPRDVLTTEATNSEAIGVIFKSVPIPSYAWSRTRREIRGTGYEFGK